MGKAFKMSVAIVPAAAIVVGLLLLTGCGNSDSEAWSGACGNYINEEHEACASGQEQAKAGESQTVACQGDPYEEACIHGWEYVKEAGYFGIARPGESPQELTDEASAPLAYVGTIKVDDEAGTVYVDRYKIGPLEYGEEAKVPQPVLASCGYESTSEIAASVFAPGQIELTYAEGALPDTIAVAEEGTVRSESDEAELGGVLQVASFIDGGWHCLGEEGGFEIQPGQTMVIPIWLAGDLVLSNERPRLSEEEINNLYITPVGSMALGAAGSTSGYWHISGPGAAECPGYGYTEHKLMLYGRSGKC